MEGFWESILKRRRHWPSRFWHGRTSGGSPGMYLLLPVPSVLEYSVPVLQATSLDPGGDMKLSRTLMTVRFGVRRRPWLAAAAMVGLPACGAHRSPEQPAPVRFFAE